MYEIVQCRPVHNCNPESSYSHVLVFLKDQGIIHVHPDISGHSLLAVSEGSQQAMGRKGAVEGKRTWVHFYLAI